MGTNRRYAHRGDARMDDRILERVSRDGPLQTLTPDELELEEHPLTITPRPEPVRAWVRFGDTPVRVDAEALRWTPRAIGIPFRVGERELRTWVWASAVDRHTAR
ncbi:hypothetical protein E4V99_14650 [Microbacterium sp. dk485]|uniref:hypothetical protein n=1 Tax=Microbacterium sp. dk485 TaxID=2560021 RepID=UPI001073A071|nr:hypothetical protein [Microbacterium sp. dk485]TFV82151.1 hypothetical protein E4V99_14650 [Microbacterium sp. dk485]